LGERGRHGFVADVTGKSAIGVVEFGLYQTTAKDTGESFSGRRRQRPSDGQRLAARPGPRTNRRSGELVSEKTKAIALDVRPQKRRCSPVLFSYHPPTSGPAAVLAYLAVRPIFEVPPVAAAAARLPSAPSAPSICHSAASCCAPSVESVCSFGVDQKRRRLSN